MSKETEKYYKINNSIKDFYKDNLNSKGGITALKYLKERGIDKSSISEFNIGLATNTNVLKALGANYNAEDILNTGISINDENVFKNRIIFPIIDENNNVVSFTGRIYLEEDLKNTAMSKYLNLKDTAVYKKSNTLYNINNAQESIKNKNEIIITEGITDAIIMNSIGYKNVVALMGTNFTKEHLNKILKLNCKVILCLDQDEVGKNATINIGKELIENNIDTSVIVFDDYKDCNEYVLNKGKKSFDIIYNSRYTIEDYLKNN